MRDAALVDDDSALPYIASRFCIDISNGSYIRRSLIKRTYLSCFPIFMLESLFRDFTSQLLGANADTDSDEGCHWGAVVLNGG